MLYFFSTYLKIKISLTKLTLSVNRNINLFLAFSFLLFTAHGVRANKQCIKIFETNAEVHVFFCYQILLVQVILCKCLLENKFVVV